jgi:hypothetical protein
MMSKLSILTAAVTLSAGSPPAGDISPEHREFFEKQVRPLLVNR